LGAPGSAGPLVEQLRALSGEGADRLVLMGDLSRPGSAIPASRRRRSPRSFRPPRLAAAGNEIDYIEGNRDFFLGRSPYADAFDAVVLETSFTVAASAISPSMAMLERPRLAVSLLARLSESRPSSWRFAGRRAPRPAGVRVGADGDLGSSRLCLKSGQTLLASMDGDGEPARVRRTASSTGRLFTAGPEAILAVAVVQAIAMDGEIADAADREEVSKTTASKASA